VRDGYVCNFQMTCLFSPSWWGKLSPLTWVLQNANTLSPMMLAFGRKAKAQEASRFMNANGLRTQFVDSYMSRETRERVKAGLEHGSLSAVCIVGVFNEGTSINALRTVVFMDVPYTGIKRKQLAMRTSRLHKTKKIGHVVVVVDEKVKDDRHLSALLTSFATEGYPTEDLGTHGHIRKDSRGKSYFGSMRVKVDTEHAQEHDLGFRSIPYDSIDVWSARVDAGTRVFSGALMSIHKAWTTEMQHFLESNGGRPPSFSNGDRQERRLAMWFSRMKRRYNTGMLSDQEIGLLQRVPVIKRMLKRWRGPRTSGRGLDQDLSHLKMWVKRHDRLPRKRCTTVLERRIWSILYGFQKRHTHGSLGEHRVESMREVPMLKELVDSWRTLRLNATEKSEHLVAWVNRTGRMPLFNSDDAEERLLNRLFGTMRQRYFRGIDMEGSLEVFRRHHIVEKRLQEWSAHREDVQNSTFWQEVGSGFSNRITMLVKWVEVHDRLPEIDTDDLVETSFAKTMRTITRHFFEYRVRPWLYATLTGNPLLAQRLDLLRKQRDRIWENASNKLARWTDDHNRLPYELAEDNEEAEQYQWLRTFANACSREELNEACLQALQRNTILNRFFWSGSEAREPSRDERDQEVGA